MFIFAGSLSSFFASRRSIAGLAALAGPAGLAQAQSFKGNDPAQSHDWARAANAHAQKMRMFKDSSTSVQTAPLVIPKFEEQSDPSGLIATFQPGGPTTTATNAFFQNLGTNGRTCFTCHQPETGWTVSAASVQARFKASGGNDPIFRLVDGATCPSDHVSTLAETATAYRLLTGKGLIRIGLALPDSSKLQFKVDLGKLQDPYNCTANPVTGLTSPTSGIMSVYRRPLPSTNLGFLSTIMWDGREPTLEDQAIDATTGHAQAKSAPNVTQQAQIIAFETGVFTSSARSSVRCIITGGIWNRTLRF